MVVYICILKVNNSHNMKTVWNNNVNFLLLAVLITTFMSSCVVSKKQFDQLLAEKVKQDAEMQSLQDDLEDLNAKVATIESELASTTELKDNLSADLDKTSAQLDELLAEHDQLKTYYNNALSKRGKFI